MGLANRTTIAKEVAYVLGLPYRQRSGEAFKLVSVIVSVITSALLRGEEVKVPGFGTFSIATRKGRRYPVPYRHKDIGDVVGKRLPPPYRGVWKFTTKPDRKYVKFTPSQPLLRMINDN